MSWTSDPRTEKRFGGGFTMISQTDGGETAHLVSLSDGHEYRVLPDGQSSGQKRSRVIVAALTGLQAMAHEAGGSPALEMADEKGNRLIDPVTYLVGALTLADLTWERVNELAEVTIHEWFTNWWDEQGVERPDRAAKDLLDDLGVDGWAIVRTGVE